MNNAAFSDGQPCCCVEPAVYAAPLPGLYYYCLNSRLEIVRGADWVHGVRVWVKLGNLYYVKVRSNHRPGQRGPAADNMGPFTRIRWTAETPGKGTVPRLFFP